MYPQQNPLNSTNKTHITILVWGSDTLWLMTASMKASSALELVNTISGFTCSSTM